MNPTRRIAFILIVIFLIPALFFSVYEISSLNKDEQMIEEIYQRQLETILFSVNQYSDDLLNSWMSKTQTILEGGMLDNSRFQNFLALNTPIKAVFFSDTIEQRPARSLFSLDSSLQESSNLVIDKELKENYSKIEQLVKYKKSGFQKAEVLAVKDSLLSNSQLVVFIIENSNSQQRVAGFILDPEVFIEDLVGPRLQSVAKDQFILQVADKVSNTPIYSTLANDTTTIAVLTKDFWIFPSYSLGIRTQGSSLKDLVRERTQTNLFLLIGLDVILVIALFLAFRSVKKEVQLAHNKADFVSNVSHEIRTPLALISMFAETLEMGRVKSEEKKQEYYSIINKETHRLTGIVNKILNFSQTEAGKKKLRISRINLVHEVEDVLKTYDFHLTNKGFSYTFDRPNAIWVMADKEALAEIVINLIDNAVKYSSENKKIEITAGTGAETGWLAVKDHGVGISKTDQKHIFDKFYRVSSGNLAKSLGTGLGLSLVKQLVEEQKGKISVSSELGKGSVFTIYLPLDKRN
jgi:two-component system, OmpR family, phosphate regulon sensor histidine kinase PhoR